MKCSGSGLRESAMMDVMVGFARACIRTSVPMKPLEPLRMSFMSVVVDGAKL